MDRVQKKQEVEELKGIFDNASTVVICHYRGLAVAEMEELRHKARDAGASVKVVKNSLAKIAANDTKFDVIKGKFSGPVAISYSKDEVQPAKIVFDFAKDAKNLKIIAGSINGQLLDQDGVKSLSKTPSLDESKAKILGLLTATQSKLVRIIGAPGQNVVTVLGQYAKKSN